MNRNEIERKLRIVVAELAVLALVGTSTGIPFLCQAATTSEEKTASGESGIEKTKDRDQKKKTKKRKKKKRSSKKKSTSRSRRFKDHKDKTVTDSKTGLMWTKNANLLEDTLTFYEARDYIEGMNEGKYPNFGYTDWRLPTLQELRSLLDYTKQTKGGYKLPKRNPFKNLQSMRFHAYKSYSYISNSSYPTFFSFYCRLVDRNVKSCYGYVWPVRSLNHSDKPDR